MTKLVDLTQPWSPLHAIPYLGYPSPSVKFVKRFPSDGAYAQLIETTLHVGTHMDAPLHWLGPGYKDMASIPLDRLYGQGVIVDISHDVTDWDIIKPDHVLKRADVRQGDILILHTGFHRYYSTDEERYLLKHPGPGEEFAQWALQMELRWIGCDFPSADHPMNGTIVPRMKPELVKEFETKQGKSLDVVFPRSRTNPMHKLLFPHDIVHAENVGGDIEQVLDKRCNIGAFPWRFVGGEASICRVVAFLED